MSKTWIETVLGLCMDWETRKSMISVSVPVNDGIPIMIEKISKDIDNIDIGWNTDTSISKILISIYHIKNVDTIKSVKNCEK